MTVLPVAAYVSRGGIRGGAEVTGPVDVFPGSPYHFLLVA